MDDISPEGDTIKIEYHPSSGRENEVVPAEDFVKAASLGSTHPVGLAHGNHLGLGRTLSLQNLH